MKFTELPTPCYLLDENRLVQNLAVLRDVARRTGAKILLAQKAFSMFSVYPLIREYLAGTTASGLYEARLGHEEFGGETHVYAPAYAEGEFREILEYADHIVFNSPAQLAKFGPAAKAAGKSVGLRINPERSTQEGHAIYDPCAPGSRLGTTRAQWAVGRATANAPDLAEAKFAYDSLAHPLKGAGCSSYAIEMEPAVAEAYGRMLKRVTFALDKAWIFAIFAGFGCGIGYVATLRVMTDELAIFFFLLYAVMSLSGYLMTFAQIALFNRVLPRGVRLTFRILRKRFPDLGSSVMDFNRMIVLAGLILFGLMALTR